MNLTKICRYFKHLDKTQICRPPEGLIDFAVDEFDFVRNVEVGKEQTRRVKKVSIATQTDELNDDMPFNASPSVFSRKFREMR